MYIEVVKAVLMKRLTRLQRLMEANNLSALILFEDDFIAHKLSLTQHFNIVLITPIDAYIIADITLCYEAQQESSWSVVAIKNFTLDELTKRILSLLSKDGSKVRLGVNKSWGRNKISFLYKDLLDALQYKGIETIDATHILAEVFDKPYEEELLIIKWISNIASKVLEAVYESLKPGMREYEVAAIIDKWFTTIVASGPRAASPHARTSSRKIRYGEPVVVDMGPVWMGYDGCIAHTFIAGQNKYWESIIEKVSHALSLGLEEAKPGTPVNVLDGIPRKEFEKQGLPNYPHLSGHPIGGFYKPVIADFVNYELEANMVFAYEPAAYIHGKGGARIEPHVLVTLNGHEILTEFHRRIL